MPAQLATRRPGLDPHRLVAELVPPPRFDRVRFHTYHPDLAEPTQMAVVAELRRFAAAVGEADRAARPGWTRRLAFRGAGPAPGARGRYLDGGFGVGKTHLLASLWHAVPGPKVFATFVELTSLVGALGFARTVAALSCSRLLCVDEFELDDPGDTVLISSLLDRLVGSGVRLAATSNTLPDRLGEGRFAATDFLREIQGLAAHFAVVRVDGPDYRHRGLPEAPEPGDPERLVALAKRTPGASLDDFTALLEHLGRVHPSRYRALLDGVDAVFLRGVTSVGDQAAALRLVVLADRLYDRNIPVLTSGVPLEVLFTPQLLAGGYRKKYLRAVSRLAALTRSGARLAASSGAPD